MRAGQVPYVWGEFDVDCRTNRITGLRQSLLDQLDRGYVRAAPGRLVASTFDPATGVLRGAGANAPLGSALVAWYPAPVRQIRTLAAQGLTHLQVSSSGTDGGSYVTAFATRATWSVTIGA